MIFVDTSALRCMLSSIETMRHTNVRVTPERAGCRVEYGSLFVTSNYVLVEFFALLEARLGVEAVRVFHDAILPVLQVIWTTWEDHESAVQALFEDIAPLEQYWAFPGKGLVTTLELEGFARKHP